MKVTSKFVFCIYLYLIIGLFFCLQYNTVLSTVISSFDISNIYIFLISSYFFIVGLFIVICFFKKMDIFEPFIFCSLIMILLFIITPIINLIINDILCFGEDVMGTSIYGTLIFDLSYLSFCFGYLNIKRTPIVTDSLNKTKLFNKRKKIVRVSLLMWVFCFACSIVYIMNSGASLGYILSLGMFGTVSKNDISSTPIGFIGMFGYSLVTIWMIILVYSKNNPLKFIVGGLTLTSYLIRGFRFIIVIMFIAPIMYFYIKRGKRPNMFKMGFLVFLLIIMIGIVGFSRNALRSGHEIAWNDLSIEVFTDALKGNFDIYKSYYGVLNAIPNKMSYTYGSQILYTFIMFIPRFFWSTKPQPLQSQIVKLGLNETAAKSGFAFPNLGEYYAEFGLIGCIIILYILGSILGRLKKLYQSPKRNENKVIMYCVLIPATMQLIIRGYTPSNFYLIVFLLLPISIINFIKG